MGRRGWVLLLVLACGGAARTGRAQSAAAEDFVRAGTAEALPAELQAALTGLSTPALAAHVAFLASPALEGRGLGTIGFEAAAEYAASELMDAGVAPVGGPAGSRSAYFQLVPLREIRRPSGLVKVERRSGSATQAWAFTCGVDCLLPAQSARTITAPVVFAGYGLRESVPERDDYRGLDVQGRIVAVLEGLPSGEAWRTKELLARHAAADGEERWAAKLETARSLGAVGVLAIEGETWTDRLLGRDKPPAAAFRSAEWDERQGQPLLARVSPAVGRALLEAPEDKPRSLAGVTATITVTGEELPGVSRNVVGLVPGSDPALAEQAVVVGAHLDHLGRVDGRIHPGADDNASGVAALLEISRAFGSAPRRPKRTVVVAFWAGEEEDKIGSSHYVRHPLWPLEKTVAYLNLDMIGHPWTAEEIGKLVGESGLPNGAAFLEGLAAQDFVEPGVASYARDLGPLLARAGRGTGLALHLDWTEGISGGSDYRSFARARVPFVRFFGNFFPAYHEPGDTPEALDVAQAGRVARLALATAWLLADR